MDNVKTLWQKFFHATKLYFPVRTQVNMTSKIPQEKTPGEEQK